MAWPSETAADLSPAENLAHLKQFGFGRPFIASERLARVLAATKPDLLFACYGMNDGSSLPPDASGTKRFAEAMTRLRETSIQAGVKRVVLCTPPVQDAKGEAREKFHDENLSCYTAWLLSKRADGWDVVDLHIPMRAALDAGRALDPTFEFAKDGVHPGPQGPLGDGSRNPRTSVRREAGRRRQRRGIVSGARRGNPQAGA